MNILLLTAHSIAEYDDLRMLTDLGYETFSIGAYSNPQAPGDDKRPAIEHAPYFREMAELTADQMRAKEHIPDAVLDWADTIIVHHYPERWIAGQWGRIKRKRVIWRTCGQSNPQLEQWMKPFVHEGLQVVRYSPKERIKFEAVGSFAGEDALIRFGKYPSDFPSWTGEGGYIANVTQHMARRPSHCGTAWYLDVTDGLHARPAGPGSEELPGGIGELPAEDLYGYLAKAGAYLYTGTLPASYTLGFVEALMVGVPIVSIGPSAWGPKDLFEAHELSGWYADDPTGARRALEALLTPGDAAQFGWFVEGMDNQSAARDLFNVAEVGQHWKEFLG